MDQPSAQRIIRTPDQRLRVFVSSTLQELADERVAARDAIAQLHLSPVMFELGARPHPPRDLYRAYLDQSHIFIGLYWQKYGWIAPGESISGLEDEYRLSGRRPKLIYLKQPAPDREARLSELLDRLRADDTASYKYFSTPAELRDLIANDLALLLTESFESIQTPEPQPTETRRPNLPVPPTPLIGREAELATAREWLLRGGANLITVTGPGGSGKTRLALQLALDTQDQFRDGVYWVPLAAIADPNLVVATIAGVFDLRESPGSQALIQSLKRALEDKHLLLVLDNFEQVVTAADIVAELLEACPWLKIVVASRAPLHIRGERQFPVPPLALPERQRLVDLERLSQYAAVELFIQRAQAVKPGFAITNETAPAVAEICHQLDGLPLAIELAAARIKLFSPQALLSRLKSRLDVLTSGARDLPARQQTLRNAIDWSYNLLSGPAKVLFRRLSVFAASFTLDAVEAVCNLDGDLGGDVLDEIDTLVDNSLMIQADEDGELRFGLLGTIREYAQYRLIESSETAIVQERQAQWVLQSAEEAQPYLLSPQRPNWLPRLQLQHGDFRAALAWSHAHAAEFEARLSTVLIWFWYFAGYIGEGRTHLEHVLQRIDEIESATLRVNVKFAAGAAAAVQGDYAVAHERLTESVAALRQSSDRRLLAYAILFLGLTDSSEGDTQTGLALLRESLALFQQIGDRWGEAYALSNFSDMILNPANLDAVRAEIEAGLKLWRSLGDTWGIGHQLVTAGSLAWYDGDYAASFERGREAVELLRQHNDKWGLARGVGRLGYAALYLGDVHQARAHFVESLALWQEIGNLRGTVYALVGLAGVAARSGQLDCAARLFGAVHALIGETPLSESGIDRVRYERTLALARDRMSPTEWTAAFNAGQVLSRDQAIALALEEVSEAQPIVPAATERPVDNRLRQYIPKELLAKLQAIQAGRKLEGERRIVTFLFCDVKGSTALARSLDPEEWAEIINGAFEQLIKPIYRYEGTVARLMGDGVLAFFGAPLAHEDDAYRAVRAGLDIVAGIQQYRAQVKETRGLDLDVRVGVNTGPVVVGEVGSDLRVEYTALGDAINLASRMEQTAQPGTVQITENTYQLIAPWFEIEPLGRIEIKGYTQPITTYRALAVKARPERLHGAITPLIGRENELIVLRHALTDAQRGRGRIVSIIGEAGLGKTRLIEELHAEWASAPSANARRYWYEEHTLAYATAQPYGQIRLHLYSISGIAETDPPAVMRAKLTQMLDQYAPDDVKPRALKVYTTLLGLEDRSGHADAPLTGDAFKRELFEVMVALQRALLIDQSAVLVFDDVHWIDAASMELLAYLFRLTDELPLLIVCAFRPERDAPVWRLKQIAETDYGHRYSELVLQPLSNEQSYALVDSVIGGLGVAAALREHIVGKAEGNPFFLEEVALALKDRPAQDSVPNTLQAVLMARLDRLDEDARRTLQVAAVIGRSFYRRVLKAVCDPAIDVDRHLNTLQRADVIRESARVPEAEFTFRYGLMQEVTYESILIKQRRVLHRQIGETLEALYADRLEEHAALLAQHFDAGGDPRAAHYYRQSGEVAARLFANAEALAHFTRALELTTEARAALLEARAAVHLFMGRMTDAIGDFDAALALAREHGDGAAECRLLTQLASAYWSVGHSVEGLARAHEAEAKAAALGDQSLALQASIVIGNGLQNDGHVPEAYAHLRRALYTSRASHDQVAEGYCRHQLAVLDNFMGRFGRAAIGEREVVKLAHHLGNRIGECATLFYLSLSEGGRGRYDAAWTALENGYALAQQIRSPLWLARYPNQRAWLSAELGDWETAYEIDHAGLEPARDVPGLREFEISTLINLVLDGVALNRLDEAEAYLIEAQRDVGRPEFGSHNWRWRTRLADAKARLALARGQLAEAEQAIDELLQQAEVTRARKYLARGLVLRADGHRQRNNLAAAESDLLAAISQADGMCYFPTRVGARCRLREVYAHTGSTANADRMQQEFAELMAELDRTLHQPDLRRSFEKGMAADFIRKGQV
ncbi:MAG: adenylate/guanylate cyclase domain-containing protein [Anaerolineae bacterium]